MEEVGEHAHGGRPAVGNARGAEEGERIHHEEIGGYAVHDQPPCLLLQPVALLEASLRLVLQHTAYEVEAEDGERDDVGPGRAVPEARDEEGEEDGEAPPRHACRAAHHGVVEVVHEPGGERDVVALPEVLHAGGVEVGVAEVVHQAESHDAGAANGDVAVAGKVAVDLEAV